MIILRDAKNQAKKVYPFLKHRRTQGRKGHPGA